MKAPLPTNEAQRLAALKEYHVLDTEAEQVYDDITALAAHICGVPIALISLVDESRQWFKSRCGLEQEQTPRDVAFCAYAIMQDEPMYVSDALEDERFKDNVLVSFEPRIRFYGGVPLVNPAGYILGTLCVVDRKPRYLTTWQRTALQILARQVVALLEMRRISSRLAEALAQVKILEAQIATRPVSN